MELPDWWLPLVQGLLEVPLGVLALPDPGATLAVLATVGGIGAVAIRVMRVVMSFEVERLPSYVDHAFSEGVPNGTARSGVPAP